MTATKTLRPQAVKAILVQAGHREAHPMGTVAGGGWLPGCDTSYEYDGNTTAKTGRVIVIHRSVSDEAMRPALSAYASTLIAAGLTVELGYNGPRLYVTAAA